VRDDDDRPGAAPRPRPAGRRRPAGPVPHLPARGDGAAAGRPRQPSAAGGGSPAQAQRAAFGYIAGAAGMETTARANRAALDRVRIVPRRLVDVSRRDLSTELFGARMPAPVYLAPIGVLELAHRSADLGAARAAAE